jgi:hypothetical protein
MPSFDGTISECRVALYMGLRILFIFVSYVHMSLHALSSCDATVSNVLESSGALSSPQKYASYVYKNVTATNVSYSYEDGFIFGISNDSHYYPYSKSICSSLFISVSF